MDVKDTNNELELWCAKTKEGKWRKKIRIVQDISFVIQKNREI